MPELPEVQTVVTDLIAADLVGRRITAARVFWPRTIAAPAPAQFGRRIKDRTVSALGRRGKLIVIALSGGLTLLVHLRMSGRLVLGAAKASPYLRVRLYLDDGRALDFIDTRKFGRFTLTADPGPLLDRLGMEPLDRGFTPARLADCLDGSTRALKALLLDQGVIVGIGNIYADEALWQARLHPARPANSLSKPAVKALHRAIVDVLEQGIANRGTTFSAGKAGFHSANRQAGRNLSAIQVFRRTGQPCPRCDTPIARMIVGQRSTHYCPRCQPPSRAMRCTS